MGLVRHASLRTLREKDLTMKNQSQRKLYARAVRACCATGAALVAGLMIAEVRAQDFTYSIVNRTVTITGCTDPNGFVGALSLPSTIAGLPVTSIASGAFVTNVGLTSLTLPGSITNFGNGAFAQCENLTNVTIGDGPTSIGFWTFSSCHQLSNVTLPGSLTSLGQAAFFECVNLTNITLPASLTNIAPDAFSWCYHLKGVYFKGNAPTIDSKTFVNPPGVTVYYLPGTTGWGSTIGGAPTKLWNPQAQTSDASFGLRQNRFGFNIIGTPDIPLVIEATPGLATRSWVPQQTCTLTNGLLYFSDPEWTNYPSRLYRIRSP